MNDVVPVNEIYDGLSNTDISRVQQATKEIRLGARIAVRSMVAIGKRLKEVKAILTANGQWRRWLEEEFDSSHDSADRMIRIAEAFPNDASIVNFQKSALYFLSDQPQAVRDVALGRAANGEQITNQAARDIAASLQKAAIQVLEEAIATQGTVTLDNRSVTIVGDMQEVSKNGETAVYGTISKPVLDAALAQTVAENLKKDKDTVIRHILSKGQKLGKVEFLSAGTLADFQKIMKSGKPQQFDGQLYISLWGLPRVKDE